MYRTMMVMVVAGFGFAFLSSIPWIHAHLIWVLWWMLVLVGACCSVLLVVFYMSLLQNHEPLCGKGFSSTKKDFTPT